MAVRRRRPLVPPPYPRRNRYIPISAEQTALHCSSSSNRKPWLAIRVWTLKRFGNPFTENFRGMLLIAIITYFPREVCYNSVKFET